MITAPPISDGSNTPALGSSAIFESLPREAGAALETYKKRDATKGTFYHGQGEARRELTRLHPQSSCGSRRRETLPS
jgi:hypothetical protein